MPHTVPAGGRSIRQAPPQCNPVNMGGRSRAVMQRQAHIFLIRVRNSRIIGQIRLDEGPKGGMTSPAIILPLFL